MTHPDDKPANRVKRLLQSYLGRTITPELRDEIIGLLSEQYPVVQRSDIHWTEGDWIEGR